MVDTALAHDIVAEAMMIDMTYGLGIKLSDSLLLPSREVETELQIGSSQDDFFPAFFRMLFSLTFVDRAGKADARAATEVVGPGMVAAAAMVAGGT